MNWAGGRGRCEAGRAATHPGARQLLAVLEARDRGVEARVGIAVLPCLVVRRHHQHRLRHMQRAQREREAVVVGREVANRAGDAVVGDRARHRGRARAARSPRNSRRGEGLAVLEARDRGVEARVGVAVLAVLVVCGHGQRGGTHGQRAANEAEVVVGGGQAALGAADGIATHAAREGGRGGADGCARDHRCEVTVDEAGDGVGQARVARAIDLALGISGRRQPGRGHSQRAVDIGDAVVGRAQTGAAADRVAAAHRAARVGVGRAAQAASDD